MFLQFSLKILLFPLCQFVLVLPCIFSAVSLLCYQGVSGLGCEIPANTDGDVLMTSQAGSIKVLIHLATSSANKTEKKV